MGTAETRRVFLVLFLISESAAEWLLASLFRNWTLTIVDVVGR